MGVFFAAARLFLGGIFKGIWKWLCARSPLELLAMALIVVCVWLLISRGNAREDAAENLARAEFAEKANAEACQAARKAAQNPKLDCRQLPTQIRLLGEALAETTGALNSQNAAIQALEAQRNQELAAAAQALKRAQPGIDEALGTSARLRASSERAPGPGEDQCAPSEALEEAWQ